MALQGTLDTFSLPDVLRLLATTSKTGRLRIDGDRGQGSVWLDGGSVVEAAADRAVDGTPTDEVVFELLRFDSGTFAFDADDNAPRPGRADGVEDILRRATSLLGEWNELEAVVPSLAHHVTLAPDLSADEVTIDADRWKTVVAVASGRTVGELAKDLGLTELGVSRVVRDLVELGVADVDGPGRPESAPRAEAPSQMPRRAPAPGPVTEPLPVIPDIPDIPEPLPEGQRAGWRSADKTGEVPAVDPPDPGPLPSRLATGRTPAPPAPPPVPGPSEPVVPSARNDTGRTPIVRPADTGRTPIVRRRPADDAAATPIVRPADTGRVPRVRPSEPAGPPTRSADNRPPGRAGDTRPARPGLGPTTPSGLRAGPTTPSGHRAGPTTPSGLRAGPTTPSARPCRVPARAGCRRAVGT